MSRKIPPHFKTIESVENAIARHHDHVHYNELPDYIVIKETAEVFHPQTPDGKVSDVFAHHNHWRAQPLKPEDSQWFAFCGTCERNLSEKDIT